MPKKVENLTRLQVKQRIVKHCVVTQNVQSTTILTFKALDIQYISERGLYSGSRHKVKGSGKNEASWNHEDDASGNHFTANVQVIITILPQL